ncbi:MAG: HD domain-containing phosphohydrolase [Campylobacterota bacterium]|nr:HD domain-containing phosphohydrolase [Campylobacterota bacterium]
MDKKKQINFNLNNFLLATSDILDCRDIEENSTTKYHSKRVAFIALKIGEQLNLDPKMMFTLSAYSLFHNYINIDNCVKLNIIDDMGILTKIVDYSHHVDQTYSIDKKFVSTNPKHTYIQLIEENFLSLSQPISFWLDLQDKNAILHYIYSTLHDFTTQPTFEQVLETTTLFGNLFEDVTPLLEKCSIMADFYNFEHKDKITFLISASMLNFGKLTIPKNILNKTTLLSDDEYDVVKSSVYHNKKALSGIYGFDDISKWASKHQEQLKGEGYPYGIGENELSLKDRLMACINIYNALTQDKLYRKKYTHIEAIDIMNIMGSNNEIDISIINDIKSNFSS